MAAGCELSEANEYKHFFHDSFVNAVQGFPAEKRFHTAAQGPELLRAVSNLSVWIKDGCNAQTLSSFCVQLGMKLKDCFKLRGNKLIKDKIWGYFHQLRTSSAFIKDWDEFLKTASISMEGSFFFYQHITMQMMNDLIAFELSAARRRHSAARCSETTHQDWQEASQLTFLEQNALRYVSGYICRKVRDKFKDYTEPLQGELSHAIMELAGDEAYTENTEEWLNKIDRGGLWHVNDDTYELFLKFELMAKTHFKMTEEVSDLNLKKRFIDAIMADEDIKFHWCLLSVDMTSQSACVLFKEMLSLFTTVRGFAFTTGCIEFYKQHRKENLQKKKALRKLVK